MELIPNRFGLLVLLFLVISWGQDVAAFGFDSSLKMMAGEGRESPLISATSPPSTTKIENPLVNATRTVPAIRKVKRIQKAPLVDSTLLRFLSAQKNEITKTSEENDSIPPLNQSINTTLSEINSAQIRDGNLDKSDGGTGREESISRSDMTDVMSQGIMTKSSWINEYNSQNVASKLIAIGVSVELAMEAGHAVNQHAIARTTRQRVRKFLSDRDAVWATSKELFSDSEERIGQPNEMDEMKANAYSIDDVIDVLINSGLTGKDIASIMIHTPSISMMKARHDTNSTEIIESFKGETLEDTLNRSYYGVLLGTIKLRKYDARKVLRSCPGLLTKRGSLSSEEVIKMLASLGASPTSLIRDKAALPILLSRSPASLFRLVSFLSSDAVRMPVKKIGPLIRQAKCASLLDKVAPLPSNKILTERAVESVQQNVAKIDELPLQKRFNRNEGIENQINMIYKQMFTTAKSLRRELQVENMGEIISAYPNILMLDIDDDIYPKINYLHERIGIEADDIPRLIESFPLILEYDVEKMEEVVEYVLSLGVDEEVLGSIFRAFPALLTQDIDQRMKPAVAFLKEIGITNIGRFVTRLPPVLGYSVENELIPKWRFLKTVTKYPVFDIMKFPAYFSYPLERVIVSRYRYLYEVKRIPLQLLSIEGVLSQGDKDFAIQVAKDKNGNQYAEYLAKRLKSKRNRSGKRKKRNQSDLDR